LKVIAKCGVDDKLLLLSGLKAKGHKVAFLAQSALEKDALK